MYIVKAEANQVEKIVDMSVRAFETDVYVGGVKGDCPPEFDSVEWHKQMAREGHLYQAMIGKDLVGIKTPYCDSLCPIRQCAMGKQMETCGSCREMERCEKLGAITEHNADALKRLKTGI